ncbi:30S ribosomal protein S27e [Candidatus Bathyarchaeota archaeon]|nr:30S ribosomal protein S27e [Candidatus Bathyarchaeota archaeon]
MFLRVKCLSCESEQVVFSSCSHVVKCRTCGEVIAEPTGGKAKINGSVMAVLG